MEPEAVTPHWVQRLRKGALPVALWAFGFSTSLMLLGMWGRTVTVDSATMEETAQTIIDSDLARQRVGDWLEAGIRAAAGVEADSAEQIADAVVAHPEFSHAVDLIVAQFVAGLFAEPGDEPTVEVDQALEPLVPIAVREANERNIPVDETRVAEALHAASAIPLDTGEAATIAAVVVEAHVVLTRVVVVAALALVMTATTAIGLAERRYAMVRTLSTRVLLSAVSYALLFQVASWALDPEQGRAPALAGGSVVLGSNSHVFLTAAAAAAGLALWGGTVAWRRARVRTTIADVDDQNDTRELLAIG